MGEAGIHHVELLALALLLATAMLTTLARRFGTPYPIVLVIGGLILSLLPRLGHISLSPHLVFLVFSPTARFFRRIQHLVAGFPVEPAKHLHAGVRTGWIHSGRAVMCDWLLPGVDWRLGCALGAVVSTTDTIAAIAMPDGSGCRAASAI